MRLLWVQGWPIYDYMWLLYSSAHFHPHGNEAKVPSWHSARSCRMLRSRLCYSNYHGVCCSCSWNSSMWIRTRLLSFSYNRVSSCLSTLLASCTVSVTSMLLNLRLITLCSSCPIGWRLRLRDPGSVSSSLWPSYLTPGFLFAWFSSMMVTKLTRPPYKSFFQLQIKWDIPSTL